MFAVRDEDYPGDWFYRLQYYHPDEGEILRYDNAHDDDELGWHHRHGADNEDTEIAFLTLTAHVARFLHDVAALIEEAAESDTDSDTHDEH